MDIRAAHTLAIELMRQHGLFVQGALGCSNGYSWSFKWDTAQRRFGQCSYANKTISLSKTLVEINDEAEVRDTILHEIAHALAGHTAGHGPLWKAKAAAIGARPERCYSTSNTATIVYKWHARCKACGKFKEYIQFRNPGWGTCPCWREYRAKKQAAGENFNINECSLNFHREGRLVKQPTALANKPVLLVPGVKSVPVENKPLPVEKPTPPALVPGEFDAAKCVFLYQSGTKVVDIAVAMGYARGQGQNRVTNALKKAGVYKGAKQ